MPRFMCVKKCFSWGRLFKHGDIVDLPVGTKLPHGTDKKGGKVPYFRMLKTGKKDVAPVKKGLTQREIKTLKNRLASLYARTNLTKAEEAEKERIQARLATIDEGTSLGTRITKEEVVKKKEEEVALAAGAQPMSMAATQKMKYDKAAKAKADKKEE